MATAPEITLSDSAAAALATWRGTGTVPGPKGRASVSGGRSSSKPSKLCGQGNNLTKYWGAPLLIPKSPAASTADSSGKSGGGGDGCKRREASERGGGRSKDGGRVRTWSGGGGHAVTVDRSFEEETATPERERDGMDVNRSWGGSGEVGDVEKDGDMEKGNGGCADALEVARAGHPRNDTKVIFPRWWRCYCCCCGLFKGCARYFVLLIGFKEYRKFSARLVCFKTRCRKCRFSLFYVSM